MTPRRASKVDENQAEIVEALRKAGASVECLHAVGGGVPDLLVSFYKYHMVEAETILMEVKTEKGKLTPDQVEWHNEWRGQVEIVRSVDDALRVIGR